MSENINPNLVETIIESNPTEKEKVKFDGELSSDQFIDFLNDLEDGKLVVTSDGLYKAENKVEEKTIIEEVKPVETKPKVEETTIIEKPIVEEVKPVETKPVEKVVEEKPIQQEFISSEVREVTDEELSNIVIENNVLKPIFSNIVPVNPVYEIVLPISGYSVSVRGMNIGEVDVIRNSSMHNQESANEILLKTAFNCIDKSKIDEIGIEKFDINKFSQITAYMDLQVLLYGVTKQTFGHVTTYDINCPHCSGSYEKQIPLDSLTTASSDKIIEEIKDIIDTSDKKEKVKTSLLNTMKDQIILTNSITTKSRFLIKIKQPSINDVKRANDIVKALIKSNKLTEESLRIKDMLPYISEMAIAVLDSNRNFIPNKYQMIGEKTLFIDALNQCDNKNLDILYKRINQFIGKDLLRYVIPTFKCDKCHEDIVGAEIDFSSYFYQQVFESL